MSITKDEAQALLPVLSALRRDFHAHPELGLNEFRTAERIEAELDALGIAHRRVGKTGVWGTLHGRRDGGKAVLLRADIDALPTQERNTHAYRSQTDGVMHACGHDAHTAALLGGAMLLSRHTDAFAGEVRFAFQPAEEIGFGAKDFIADGALNGAIAVFGLHCAPDLKSGTVGLTAGPNNAGVDLFRITVHGKSAHVSAPHLGVDALYIGSQIVIALQALVTRCSPPTEPLLIGVGSFHAGETYNGVAETAVLEGTTRTVSVDTRKRLVGQIERIARETAAFYGGAAEIEWSDNASPLVNDAAACRTLKDMVERGWGTGLVIDDRPLSMSGDNFAEFLLERPGAYAYLGTGNESMPDTCRSIHSNRFDLDEAALPFGAWLYASAALTFLNA